MNDVTVTLGCGHLTVTDIRNVFIGAALPCWACERLMPWMVFRAMTDGWHFRCTRCRYARAYGAAAVTCQTAAASHAVRKHHPVAIMVDSEYIRTVKINQPELTDAPPF